MSNDDIYIGNADVVLREAQEQMRIVTIGGSERGTPGKQGQTGPPGEFLTDWRDKWSSQVTYYRNDRVLNSRDNDGDGAQYVCLNTCTGVRPNAEGVNAQNYWSITSEPGEPGTPGANGADASGTTLKTPPIRGNWATGKAYADFDLVYRKGSAYYVLAGQAHTSDNTTKPEDGAPWHIFVKQGATGATGAPGATPKIGSNGNWYIGGDDTGVKAEAQDGKDGSNGSNGSNGKTPRIDPDTKHWIIGTTDTGIVAQGTPGAPGTNGQAGAAGRPGTDAPCVLGYNFYPNGLSNGAGRLGHDITFKCVIEGNSVRGSGNRDQILVQGVNPGSFPFEVYGSPEDPIFVEVLVSGVNDPVGGLHVNLIGYYGELDG